MQKQVPAHMADPIRIRCGLSKSTVGPRALLVYEHPQLPRSLPCHGALEHHQNPTRIRPAWHVVNPMALIPTWQHAMGWCYDPEGHAMGWCYDPDALLEFHDSVQVTHDGVQVSHDVSERRWVEQWKTRGAYSLSGSSTMGVAGVGGVRMARGAHHPGAIYGLCMACVGLVQDILGSNLDSPDHICMSVLCRHARAWAESWPVREHAGAADCSLH